MTGSEIEAALAPYISGGTLTLGPGNQLGSPRLNGLLSNFFGGTLAAAVGAPQVGATSLVYADASLVTAGFLLYQQEAQVAATLNFFSGDDGLLDCTVAASMPAGYHLSASFAVISATPANPFDQLALSDAVYQVSSATDGLSAEFSSTLLCAQGLTGSFSWLLGESLPVTGHVSLTQVGPLSYPAFNLQSETLTSPPISGFELAVVLTIQSGLNTQEAGGDSPALVMSVTLNTALVTTDLTLPVMIPLQQTGQQQFLLTLDPGQPVPALSSLSALAGFTGGMTPTLSADTPLGALSIDSVSIQFDTNSRQFSSLQLAVGLGTNWSIINDVLELKGLTMVLVVPNLYGGTGVSITFSVTVSAALLVGPAALVAFVQYPQELVGIELDPTSVIDVDDFVSTFAPGTSLPGSGDLIIYDLSALADIGQSIYSLECQADGDLNILPTFQLNQLSLTVTYSDGGVSQFAFGAIFTLTTAGAQLYLTANMGQSGWLLSGGTYMQQSVNLTALVVDLLNIFGVSLPTNLPQFILNQLELQNYDTSNDSFTFTASVSYLSDDDPILQQITGTTDISYSGTPAKQWSGEISGQIVVEENAFTVAYDFKTSEVLSLTWQAQGDETLGISTLCQLVGMTSPDIPSSLDLSLRQVTASYNITNKVLVAIADSANYGSLAFVYQSGTPTSLLAFGVEVPVSFSLSDLPLVGAELAQIENIEVESLQVSIANHPLADVSANVNALLQQYAPSGFTYPTFPTLPAGSTTGVLFTATFDYGTGTLPVTVPLDGGTVAAAPAAATDALAAPPAQTTATTTSSGQVTSTTTDDGTTWFTIQKSFGPVTFQRIGLLYQSSAQTLWFELDASLAFGPLTMNLLGLGIGSPLSSFEPSFSLQGLGVSYANPPLQVMGQLVNLEPPGSSGMAFEGALVIGTGDFTLEAVGYYGDTSGFPSFFIFIDAAYVFGGPPAFFVTGVAGGFGYNSSMTLPTVEQIQTFPFVELLPGTTAYNPNVFGTPNPTTLQVLNAIVSGSPPWVTPQAGALWIAAGITFTSFEMVNSQALLVVSVGDELTVALLGQSRAQFPQQGTELYAVVQMELEVIFQPSAGVFSVQAVLSQGSFVIDPACVLTGGFAFFVWFGSSPYAGDFVLTLGGYNPGFTPPPYYPSVPQVGFHWNIDSSINISGGAYFALTPAVLMLGGELDVTYQSGNLKAWLNAHADVIVRWKPFWFDAKIGVTVGASYKINLLFTSKRVSVELGCNLELWGPPTGGKVKVDWSIIKFTISFGASKRGSQDQPRSWSDVQSMLPNTGTASDYNVLTLTPTGGLLATPAASGATGDAAATLWVVRGSSFAFSTSTSIPATTVSVGDWSASGDAFNVHPLNWAGVTATHAVTLTDENGDDVSAAFTATPVYNNVPSSLWGSPPEANGQPQVPAGNSQLVPNQLVGLSVMVNAPTNGDSAGPVNVEYLAADDLGLPNAVLPLSASAPPAGDVPVNSQTTIAAIADPQTGIASAAATSARTAIFDGLTALQYGPATNDDLNDFADEIGCSLMAEPLLVS